MGSQELTTTDSLREAIRGAIGCNYRKGAAAESRPCEAPAVWILTMYPCGCRAFACDPHRIEGERTLAGYQRAGMTIRCPNNGAEVAALAWELL